MLLAAEKVEPAPPLRALVVDMVEAMDVEGAIPSRGVGDCRDAMLRCRKSSLWLWAPCNEWCCCGGGEWWWSSPRGDSARRFCPTVWL